MRDFFDQAAAFVSEVTDHLRRRRPATSRALRRLTCETRAGEHPGPIASSARALSAALIEQLDRSRLEPTADDDVVEMSAALTGVALLGASAHLRGGHLDLASALLDGALLRSRLASHTALIQRALSVLEETLEERKAAEAAKAVQERPHSNKRRRTPEEGGNECRGVDGHEDGCGDDGCCDNGGGDDGGGGEGHGDETAAFGLQRVRAVDARTAPHEELAALVHAAAAPALLSGLAADWPALQKWADLAHLRRVAGRRLVPIEVGATHLKNTWHEAVGCEGGSVEDVGGVCEQQVVCRLDEFIDEVVLGGRPANHTGAPPSAVSSTVPVTASATRGYLAQHRLFEQVPALAADIRQPACAPPKADCRAWFGGADVSTPVHYDLHHGLLVQVVGRKRVLLWPPSARELLQAPPAGSPLANTSAVDPEALFRSVLPRLGAAAPMADSEHIAALRNFCTAVELHPGAAILIPQGWWHHTRSLTVSFSVSFWWDG